MKIHRNLFSAMIAAIALAMIVWGTSATATVPTTTNSITYTGNGVTTAFTAPFKVLDAAHLVVKLDGVTKSITTHYTVALLATSCTVTMLTAPGSGGVLTITRTVPYTQTINLRNQGQYSPTVVEQGLDRLEMQIQQIANSVDGGLPDGGTPNDVVFAYQNNTQSLSTGVESVVLYDSEVTDTVGSFSTVTGKYTVPAGHGGYYHVTACAGTNTAVASAVTLKLYKNSILAPNAVSSIIRKATTVAQETMCVTTVTALDAADTIFAAMLQSSGIAVDVYRAGATFHLARLPSTF
jgi:hypothetical protein